MRRIIWFAFWLAVWLVTTLFASAAHGQALPRGSRTGFVAAGDGTKIHYIEAGKGPAILFVPGWTMPAEIWEHQIAHFSKTHRVIAMDPRGQGKSGKPNEGYHPAERARDIKAVIDQVKLAPVVLVGWSMAVTEIAAYVEQFGTAGIAAIVLVDGIVGSDFGPELLPIFKLAASFQVDRPKTVDRFVRSMYRKPQSEKYLEWVKRASMETPLDSSIALFLGAFTADYRSTLPKFQAPTLVLVAGDDKTNPWMKVYREVAEKVPGGKLELMPDCGHALFVDDPMKFNALVEDFLKVAVRATARK